jgi:hypothetical protein
LKTIEEEWENLPTPQYVANLCIAQVTKTLDDFVGECMEDGKPKAPSMKALMKTRGYLPNWCKNTLVKEKT